MNEFRFEWTCFIFLPVGASLEDRSQQPMMFNHVGDISNYMMRQPNIQVPSLSETQQPLKTGPIGTPYIIGPQPYFMGFQPSFLMPFFYQPQGKGVLWWGFFDNQNDRLIIEMYSNLQLWTAKLQKWRAASKATDFFFVRQNWSHFVNGILKIRFNDVPRVWNLKQGNTFDAKQFLSQLMWVMLNTSSFLRCLLPLLVQAK